MSCSNCCSGDKQKNCQVGVGTPFSPYTDNVKFEYTFKTFETDPADEKPGERIKRRISDASEQIKNMLNTLIEELGVNIEEIEINKNEEGDRIESVFVYWHVDD